MQFLNPLVLLGLAAASIPLLLHLLNLRKLKTIDFSSLRFIKELQKTQIRKLKLQQILLLILRTLIVICAVFAFARPVIKSALPVFGSHVKSSVVIVLDNSFSMDVSDEQGNRLKEAKSSALQVISALKDGDEVALISSTSVIEQRAISFTSNYQLITEQIQKLGIAPSVAGGHSMLRMASSLLGNSTNINRELYLITDAQKNLLKDKLDTLSISLPSTSVFVVPIGAGTTITGQNLSVDSIAVLTRIFQRDRPVDVEAFVRNNSDKSAQGVVVGMSYNNNRVAQRSIDIPAGETRSVPLSAEPNALSGITSGGAVQAKIEIDADALDIDNKRYFGFTLPAVQRVAIVGSPRQTSFLSLMMNTQDANSSLQTRVFQADEFLSANISQYDCVILCSSASQNELPRLKNFVQNGGGLLVFADEESDFSMNRIMLSNFSFGDISEVSVTPSSPLRTTSTDKIHPLFQGVFKGTTDSRAVVESPSIVKAYPSSGGQSIISMQGGSFLSESKIGEGRILYCAVPPTSAWSNFPLTGLFPVIVFRGTSYLCSREQLGMDVKAGTKTTITLPSRFASSTNYTVTDPEGVQAERTAVKMPSGSVIDLGSLYQPGVYSIKTSVAGGGGNVVATVSSNIPAEESRLDSYSPKELQSALKSDLSATAIEVIDSPSKIAQGVARARTGTELWKLFLILALCFAIAEMIVARSSASGSANVATA